MECYPHGSSVVTAVERVDLTSDGAAEVSQGSHGSVVLLPAIAGINPYIRRLHEELAEEGYSVATIDYWHRQGGAPDLSSVEKIMAAVATVADPDVAADVDAAIDHLGAGNGVAAVGFCIGGTQALLAAANLERVKASVSYYGLLRYRDLTDNKPESPLDAAARVQVPFLGHWGDQDPLAPVGDVEELQQIMSGGPAEIYVYPGAGHAFHEDFRPEPYRVVAATESWGRTKAFLRWHVGSA